ncbi:hypothetical protein [Paenibacillus urinalis]
MNFEWVNNRLSQLPRVLSGIFFRGFEIREKSVNCPISLPIREDACHNL